jgi:hypothetical protein
MTILEKCEKRYWTKIRITTGIMVFFALSIIFFAYWKLNQVSEEGKRIDKIQANLKTCPNRVVYGSNSDPYVYWHGKVIHLKDRGCK